MATTKTKTTKTTTEVKSEVIDKEKEELKKKVAAQDKELKALQEKMDMLLNALSTKNDAAEKPKNKKTIKFINMTTGGFTIRGTRFYHLDKQFDFQMFSENEARVIVNNMPNAVANGELYIADHDFVEECELDYIYNNLLSDAQMKSLLTQNAEDICEIYKNANEYQKKIIIEMVEEKQLNNQRIDANVLVELGRLCGVDFMQIEPLEKEE